MTAEPSVTDSAEGLKQKSVPPHPLELMVTAPPAAPAGVAPATTSETANADSTAAARVMSLPTMSPSVNAVSLRNAFSGIREDYGRRSRSVQ